MEVFKLKNVLFFIIYFKGFALVERSDQKTFIKMVWVRHTS